MNNEGRADRRPMAHRAGRRSASRRPALALAALLVGLPLLFITLSGQAPTPAPASSPMAAVSITPVPASQGGSVDPAATATPSGLPSTGPAAAAPISHGVFAGDLLIADRGNNRILIVNSRAQVLWKFPVAGSLSTAQTFSADDAFLAPDGRTILASEELHQIVVRIDIATKRITWQYGHYGQARAAVGYLNTPDDAYPLANGDITVADIKNCRILEIAPDKHVVRMWGHTGVCRDAPPYSYNEPNGDTPLPDGGVLITEIRGSRVVRLNAAGRVVFDIHVPTLYPSDAQLDARGNIVVADYSNPGAVVAVSPTGHLVWRYGPKTGVGRLDHPSLAVPLADGTIVLNDDFRNRVIFLDPATGRILWQYGRTDIAGSGPDRLNTPDGVNLIQAGTILGL
jgi:outer membrane protein assembly factor BamB